MERVTRGRKRVVMFMKVWLSRAKSAAYKTKAKCDQIRAPTPHDHHDTGDGDDDDEDEEHKESGDQDSVRVQEGDINRVADLFILNFHNKMRMQKLQSFKRCQQMMDRSLLA